MARARMQQQQLYPGMYHGARGPRPQGQVTQQELEQKAKQIEMMQRLAQYKRAQENLAAAARLKAAQTNMTKVVMGGASGSTRTLNNRPAISITKSKSSKPPETVTLDDESDDDEISEVPVNDDSEEEEDEDDGEIVLDGAPEVEV